MHEQLVSIQKKQFEEFDHKHSETLSELIDIRSRMEGDQYRDLSRTNERISNDSTRLDILIQDVNKMNIEQRGEINRIENDIQNRIMTVEKLVGNELKQNY
jgi:archaellum component FlaC